MVLGYPVVSMEDGVTHGGSKRNLLGPKPTPDDVSEFSNEKQVDKNTPPTQALEFHRSVLEAGTQSILLTYPEDGHSLMRSATLCCA